MQSSTTKFVKKKYSRYCYPTMARSTVVYYWILNHRLRHPIHYIKLVMILLSISVCLIIVYRHFNKKTFTTCFLAKKTNRIVIGFACWRISTATGRATTRWTTAAAEKTSQQTQYIGSSRTTSASTTIQIIFTVATITLMVQIKFILISVYLLSQHNDNDIMSWNIK